MKETSILIKPVSSTCNNVCTYCFYDDVSNCRTVKSHGLIQDTTWKKLIDDACENYDKITFLFQGGEPLLAGYRFFEAFIDYTKNYNKTIMFAIQTNGTRLTPKLCRLFKAHNFLVGISIDGFKENHNRFRFLHGAGSFDAVMDGLNLLREFDIPFNVLTVLTSQLATKPDELYDFYKEEGFDFVQIIPCLSNFDHDDPFACNPERFSAFYARFFERWFNDFQIGEYMSEGLIDDVVKLLSGIQPSRCGMLGQCQAQCIVESNGSVYPCDFYVLDEYVAGNVNTHQLNEIMNNHTMDNFLQKTTPLPTPCLTCPFKSVCNGNCKRMRSTFVNDSMCGYRDLLEIVEDHLPQIHDVLAKKYQSLNS